VRTENTVEGFSFVSGEQWGYRVLLMGGKEILFTRSTSGPPPLSDSITTDRFSLAFNDESLAQRVLEAFKHAAALCRENEPF
jgi:ABC-type nitrate/sulfonate/bicarbonate transport system substrate-binding protein